MQTKYIDVHSHLYFSEFNEDRGEVLERMRQEGVATITIGTGLDSSKKAIDFDKEHSDISLGVTVGQHPTEREEFNAEAYRALIQENRERVRAVGECGLDYFRCDARDKHEKERQQTLFKAQIELALEFDLPLMLHIRSQNENTDAHTDAFEILKKYKETNPNLHLHMHFFTIDYDTASQFLLLGATFGIPGVVTYKSARALQEAVGRLPLERLLLESDAPYAAPVPHRGKRNEPTFVIDTARKIADLRKEDFETVQKRLLQNAKSVFAL